MVIIQLQTFMLLLKNAFLISFEKYTNCFILQSFWEYRFDSNHERSDLILSSKYQHYENNDIVYNIYAMVIVLVEKLGF